MQSFDTSTLRTAEKSLHRRDVSVSAVVCEYIKRLQDFQESLRTSGFAYHPGIVATGVKQADPMVEQVLENHNP